jgi:hypothetical protein
VTSILIVRKERQEHKRKAAYETCKDIVVQLISSVGNIDSNPLESERTDQICTSSENLLEAIRSNLEGVDNVNPKSLLSDLKAYESWPPYAALTANIGHYSIINNDNSPNVQLNVLTDNPVVPINQLDTEEKDQENAEEQDQAVTEIQDQVDTEIQDHFVLTKVPFFVESLQNILESLLSMNCDKNAVNIPLALTDVEKNALYTPNEGIVCDVDSHVEGGPPAPVGPIQPTPSALLLLGGGAGAEICTPDILRTIDWLGGNGNIEVWDVAAAVEVGRKLAPLLEGKNPLISYPTLFDIFCYGRGALFPVDIDSELSSVTLSDALKGLVLPPKVSKICAEISEVTARIMSSIPAAPNSTGAPKIEKKGSMIGVGVISYTEITFGVLLGQVLWLRNFIKEQYDDHLNSTIKIEEENYQKDSIKRKLSSDIDDLKRDDKIVPVVSNKFGSIIVIAWCVTGDYLMGDYDTAAFALAVDWFLRGGSRDNLNDSTVDVDEGKRILLEILP